VVGIQHTSLAEVLLSSRDGKDLEESAEIPQDPESGKGRNMYYVPPSPAQNCHLHQGEGCLLWPYGSQAVRTIPSPCVRITQAGPRPAKA